MYSTQQPESTLKLTCIEVLVIGLYDHHRQRGREARLQGLGYRVSRTHEDGHGWVQVVGFVAQGVPGGCNVQFSLFLIITSYKYIHNLVLIITRI